MQHRDKPGEISGLEFRKPCHSFWRFARGLDKKELSFCGRVRIGGASFREKVGRKTIPLLVPTVVLRE